MRSPTTAKKGNKAAEHGLQEADQAFSGGQGEERECGAVSIIRP
jgi:hypothetical protein